MWQQAIVTLIPKENSSCPNVGNFRPISLLNTDYKLFAKILSERLKKIVTEVISTDQAGFLPQRHIRDNIRVVLDMIELGDKTPGLKMGLFFLDTEKAFNNINWDFLRMTLLEMQFGKCFLNAVKSIYSTQKAKIKINEEYMEEFEVQKGTRQGCPLSPLVFITILDVLLKQLQKDREYREIKVRTSTFKFKAFVDDVVFSFFFGRSEVKYI